MKTKMVPVFLSVFLLSVMMFSVARAKSVGTVSANANVDVEARIQGNATSTDAKATVRGNATSTVEKNNNATSTNVRNGNATSTNAKANGQLTALEHRSAVASFVKSLLSVADRDGGIGAQVRVVAQSQNDSASTTENAIRKVENRSKLQTFIFGSDYKSLGQLRSEMVTTQNNINQLNNLIAKAANDADKAELEAQIKVLKDSQVKVEAFIKARESSFSLLGWLVKPFVK